jgi:hypothetical protein
MSGMAYVTPEKEVRECQICFFNPRGGSQRMSNMVYVTLEDVKSGDIGGQRSGPCLPFYQPANFLFKVAYTTMLKNCSFRPLEKRVGMFQQDVPLHYFNNFL